MIALVTGAGGQLGRELARTRPAEVELIALGRAELDVSDRDQVLYVLDEHRPDVVINAAAYTAVDRAEVESELAHSANARGPENLARALARLGGRLIHLSTDFVFDGRSGRPYAPDSPTAPESVYGASKLAGEKRVQVELPNASTIIRTAWVYSKHGHNFVKTMIELMQERPRVEVVSDQIGSPTWAFGLARIIWRLAAENESLGVLHWTDAGVASWYDFAVAIRDEASVLGLLDGRCRVEPTTSAEHGSRAPRPAFSVLDKTATWERLGEKSSHWRAQLVEMLCDMHQGNGHA